MRVVCAWCGDVMSDGTGPVSHGICPGCSTRVERAFYRSLLKKRRPRAPRGLQQHRVPTLPLPGFFTHGTA